MKNGWKEMAVGEILQLEYGKPLDESDRNPDGRFPVYGANGEKDRSDKFYHEKPSIIVGRKGSAGEINLTEKKFWPLDVTYFVTFDEKQYDLRFLYYLLTTLDLPKLAKGVKPGINRNEVYSQVAKVPSLPEQQRIVGILDEAFEGIATAKANAEKNLQNARALFESYHDSIFTRKNENWVEKELGEVCEYANGKAHEQCIDENGRFIVINSKFISSEGEILKRSNKALLLLQPGEIAMVLSDVPNGKALAKCFLIEKTDTYTLNQRICLIRSQKFHTKFLFYQLNRNRHFLSFDNGENQTNLRLNQVLSCPLFLPPLAEQETIAENLDAMLEETERLESNYQQKLSAVDALEKSLLYQAFTGNL
jgi:type I restriction enzyme, S subunit